MYPGHRKTALPSKQLQVLREINGSDGESPELLAQLSRQGPRRVVIKRPHRAPPLLERPTAEMSGKLVRYDIYQNWKAR
jgi:16S rRNA (guanine1516-N2)-methyltransferase